VNAEAFNYDKLMIAVVAAFVGIVKVKVPLVNVVEPKLCTEIALPVVVLYNRTASNAAAGVNKFQTKEADGVAKVAPDTVGEPPEFAGVTQVNASPVAV
jgi:hypothetical protein